MHRRAFVGSGALWLARTRASAGPRLEYGGVKIGIQSFCFNDRPLEQMLDAVAAVGAAGLELYSGHAEPWQLAAAARRGWRREVDLGYFRKIREQIARRGLTLFSYDLSMRSDWTDQEMDRGFQMARELGVPLITTSSDLPAAGRLDALARQYQIRVGMHNHAESKPNELATAEDFAAALAGRSNWLGITFDVGHFGAAGFDALPFLRQYKNRIFCLHLKDRKKNFGPQVPFGEGDSRLADILAFVSRERCTAPVCVEHVLSGGDRIPSIRADFQWTKERLRD